MPRPSPPGVWESQYWADAHEGENLIDERAFASIRIYEGLDPADDGGLFQSAAEEFLDVIRDDDGFIAYYWLNLSHRVVAISLFETEAQASASNEAASEYIAENLADIVRRVADKVNWEVLYSNRDNMFRDLLRSDGEVQLPDRLSEGP